MMYNESMRTYKDKNLWKENISKAKKGKIPYIASEQTKNYLNYPKWVVRIQIGEVE